MELWEYFDLLIKLIAFRPDVNWIVVWVLTTGYLGYLPSFRTIISINVDLSYLQHRHGGLVVKASASWAGGRGIDPWPCHT